MATPRPKTGTYYGWVVIGVMFIMPAYLGGVVFYGFTAIIEPIALELDWNCTTISLAASLRGVEASLLAPVAGAIVDRYGPRRLMFSGLILIGAGMLLLAFFSVLTCPRAGAGG